VDGRAPSTAKIKADHAHSVCTTALAVLYTHLHTVVYLSYLHVHTTIADGRPQQCRCRSRRIAHFSYQFSISTAVLRDHKHTVEKRVRRFTRHVLGAMNFQCAGRVRSPGVFRVFRTFKEFRSWACDAFSICSSADAMSAGVAYEDSATRSTVRLPREACIVSFILANSYTIFPPGSAPVVITRVCAESPAEFAHRL
jgi:hypothetical protein